MGVPAESDHPKTAEDSSAADSLDGILRRLAEMARSQILDSGPVGRTVEESVRRIETRMAGPIEG